MKKKLIQFHLHDTSCYMGYRAVDKKCHHVDIQVIFKLLA